MPAFYAYGFLKYSRKRGLVTMHPENLVVPRKADSPNQTILQPDDLRVLFASDQTEDAKGSDAFEWFIHAFRFQVLTGLRPGETLGLQWKDINGGSVQIRRSMDNFGNITPGKNANARRTFILPRR